MKIELLLGKDGLVMQLTKDTIKPASATSAISARNVSCFMLALHLLLLVLTVADGAWATSSCSQGDETRVWTAPLVALPGEKLEILSVSTSGDLAELLVTDPAGRQTKLPTVKAGGPPWSLRGVLLAPARGRYRIQAMRAAQVVACAEVQVGGGAGNRGDGEWDLAMQALYAAWIEHLFDASPEQSLSFPSLEPVLRDSQRNFLYDYLKRGEDRQLPAKPDCADLPYFLRAYFAWKLGLPLSYRSCSRGSASSPPRCDPPEIDRTFVRTAAPTGAFLKVSRRIMDTVNSGGGRTALRDDATDFYPVPLERSALWPGTIFADPYGHTLVIVKWVPQTENRSGLLLAVDAQPDNSVARKRFWEGNFLFAATPSAGPGFKAYRPPVSGGSRGGWRPLSNNSLNGRFGLPPYSTEQAGLAPVNFYARMERLINPRGLDPDAAYAATLDALMEQLETRVRSVDNGEVYMRAHPATVVPMPRGPAIFESTGLWEDYSTPSRDMRVLIALKVLADLPERIRRHPELYVLRDEDAAAAAARIERLHAQRIREVFITYTRSDGSPWRLSLAEIYERRPGLEIAYNPNDCVERRWGAAPGTPDYSTCRRRSPAEQRERMEEYRLWFREARRPPR
ncbi:hypothetical protein [Geomonas sp.]|uniref:hypothetical protein n=1 Tax=Geomonas sp. TaxID=2651584 RepID=UPI002B48B9B7|nr:hypothetical protein [Geomonas sp.]HJV36825.1 hypothetical protein [Geomonas sp.]